MWAGFLWPTVFACVETTAISRVQIIWRATRVWRISRTIGCTLVGPVIGSSYSRNLFLEVLNQMEELVILFRGCIFVVGSSFTASAGGVSAWPSTRAWATKRTPFIILSTFVLSSVDIQFYWCYSVLRIVVSWIRFKAVWATVKRVLKYSNYAQLLDAQTISWELFQNTESY